MLFCWGLVVSGCLCFVVGCSLGVGLGWYDCWFMTTMGCVGVSCIGYFCFLCASFVLIGLLCCLAWVFCCLLWRGACELGWFGFAGVDCLWLVCLVWFTLVVYVYMFIGFVFMVVAFAHSGLLVYSCLT